MPIENSLEGSVNATLDALAVDAPRRARSSARRPAGPPRLIARDGVAARRGRGRSSRIRRRSAQCARFLREQLPRRAGSAASSTAEAVRTVDRRGRRRARALGTALAAELYGGVVLRDGRRGRAPATRRASSWLARRGDAGPVGAGAAGAAWKTLRLLRRRRATARRAGSCAAWRSSPPRREPDADRVAARASAGSATTCSSSTSTAGATSRAPSPRRSSALARALRAGARARAYPAASG